MESSFLIKKNNLKGSNVIQALWVMLGSLSSIALSMVSAAILSRFLSKADYGTYRQVIYVYSTLLFVFSAGLPKVYSYYLPKYSLEEGKYLVGQINRMLFVLGGGFSVLLFLFSPVIANALQNESLEYLLKMFSCVPLFLLPTLGVEGVFSSYRKTKYVALYNILSRLIMLLCIVIPVLVFENKLEWSIYGWGIGAVITFFMAIYFKNIPFLGVKKVISGLSSKEILTYSYPIAIASLWGVVIKAADQFYISRYFGSEVFAEFSNGFIELPFVGMITMASSVVLMPVFSKMVHNNTSKEDLLVLWKSTLYKSALIIYPIVVFCFVYAKDIMIILYSGKYGASGTYFQINIILNFFNIIIFAPILFALGKTKFYASVHMILAIVIWVLGYLFVNVFDSAIYLAILSVSLSVIKILVFLIAIKKFLHSSIVELVPVKKISSVLLHSFLCIGFVILLSSLSFFDSRFLSIILYALIYFGLMVLTSKFFGVDYLDVIKPLTNKFLYRLKK